jgi:raffinose/stachyose/melibiose transport system permease protein
VNTPDQVSASFENTGPVIGRRFRLSPNMFGALVIIVLVIIAIYPIIWLLTSSIKAPHEFNLRPIYAFPEGFYFQNYIDAWTSGKFSIYFKNSVLVTIPSLILILSLSASTAFGIEIMRWRFKNGVLLLFLAGILIPGQMVLLPLYTMFYRAQLLDNHWGLILVYVVSAFPLSVFLITSYLKSLSHEILEAAVVDGANIYQVFLFVAVPIMKNAVYTVGLIQFFFIWNDLLLSLTFISSTNLRTIQTGLLDFVGRFGQREWGPTFASIAMSILPTLIIYLFLNKLIVRGLTAGAVKG